MKNLLLIIVGVLLGGGVSFLIRQNSIKAPLTSSHQEEVVEERDVTVEDLQEKIDGINQIDQLAPPEVDGVAEEIFGDCDPESEVKAINERLICNKKKNRSLKYWSSFEVAQKDIIDLIKNKNTKELVKYTGCDSHDLTWYEMHCESDRTTISQEHYENLFKHLANLKLFRFINLKMTWVKQKPNFKKQSNPRWILRSRLMLNGFKLNQPWATQAHPTDDKVIILIEQKLNGRIYIAGIPVTGVLGSD